MSTTPDGEYAKSIANLQSLVAASATFQTAVGAADATAAISSIYWNGMEPPDGMTTPWAWIQLRPGANGDAPASGGNGFWHTFPMAIILYRPDDSATDLAATDTPAQRNAKHKERIVAFLTFVGKCVRDWEALAKTAGYLQVTQLSLERFELSSESEPTRYQMATIGVQVS